MTRLFLSDIGIVCPLGSGPGEVLQHLTKGWQGGIVEHSDPLLQRKAWIGRIGTGLPKLPSRLARYDCRNNRVALAAAWQIEPSLKDAIARFGADRIATVVGTSTSGIAEGEHAMAVYRRTGTFPADYAYEQQEIGGLSEFLASYFGLSGPALTIATACSSSGKVFASAARMIAAGLCDAALIGGADTYCRMTLNGFASLESIAAGLCNPMSRNRDGINVGEGAALFLLTTDASEIELLGVGESSDAYHVSAPEPYGTGAIAAMQSALFNAHIDPDQIAYINLHGTATPLNDAMESRAVEAVFGLDVPCSSTKALTGHALGAAGALEAAFLWLALHPANTERLLPPHIWDGQRDETLPSIALVEPGEKRSRRQRAMLSNSFAFGGSNVSVILGVAG